MAMPLHKSNIVACVWDFDKTLIPGYMQAPLFEAFGIDETLFWEEVNKLPALYAKRGLKVSKDTVYLNHLLTYIKNGPLKGLTNKHLRNLGKELIFYKGLPSFFETLQQLPLSRPEYIEHEIKLEHYIISTGIAEIIRGSVIAPFVDGIFACEFLEDPLPPGFDRQTELALSMEPGEISQIGLIVDNTIKTRFIFEINKGSNKNPEIDVNASIQEEDRRVPIKNMLYIADGPSDIPAFTVIKHEGGKAYAVYNPDESKELEQNDDLLQSGRIHCYGPADYRMESSTARWLQMHILKICDRIVLERETLLSNRVVSPPRHIHSEAIHPNVPIKPVLAQDKEMFE